METKKESKGKSRITVTFFYGTERLNNTIWLDFSVCPLEFFGGRWRLPKEGSTEVGGRGLERSEIAILKVSTTQDFCPTWTGDPVKLDMCGAMLGRPMTSHQNFYRFILTKLLYLFTRNAYVGAKAAKVCWRHSDWWTGTLDCIRVPT